MNQANAASWGQRFGYKLSELKGIQNDVEIAIKDWKENTAAVSKP